MSQLQSTETNRISPSEPAPHCTNPQLFSLLLLYRSLPLLIPILLHAFLSPILNHVPGMPPHTAEWLTPDWNVQTMFQPDEFWQALEPAHKVVFGTGHLTWEWRDLPISIKETSIDEASGAEVILRVGPESIWKTTMKRMVLEADEAVSFWGHQLSRSLGNRGVIDSAGDEREGTKSGRIRGWLWPSIFAGIYWLLKVTGLDDTSLFILLPRLVGLFVAAGTDYYTYHLAYRLLGVSGSNAAAFLSMTNLFHAHALPRSLSTSPETFLTVLSLSYWPFPSSPASFSSLPNASKRTHGMIQTKVWVALGFAAVGVMLRPTSGVLWLWLGGELVWRRWRETGWKGAFGVIGLAVLVGALVLFFSTTIDFLMTGKIYIPILSFLSQNLLLNISSFYGTSPWHYHLFQTLPILLGMTLPWAVLGYFDIVLGTIGSDSPEEKCINLPALQSLARACQVTILVFSSIDHKEWRFLHPLLPIFLIFAASRLTKGYFPKQGILAIKSVREGTARCVESWLRIPQRKAKWLWRGILLNGVIWIYLTAFHGRGQVACMETIRQEVLDSRRIGGERVVLVELMPCHATPWISLVHLKGDEGEGWRFLRCEPPLNGVKEQREHDQFYSSPSTFFHDNILSASHPPTHLLFFGHLLAYPAFNSSNHSGDSDVTFGEVLEKAGWREKKSWWNGFDILQSEDEGRATGGVKLWVKA